MFLCDKFKTQVMNCLLFHWCSTTPFWHCSGLFTPVYARSSLIQFACIGVRPRRLFTPQLDQSRGSNSNAGKMDQTWSMFTLFGAAHAFSWRLKISKKRNIFEKGALKSKFSNFVKMWIKHIWQTFKSGFYGLRLKIWTQWILTLKIQINIHCVWWLVGSLLSHLLLRLFHH